MPKKTILVVDNKPDILEFLQKRLESQDYQVITASDGVEGLKKAISQEIDLVLLDIAMPKKDGFAMLKELKSQEATKDIQVIIVSAKRETKSILEGQNLGSFDYFLKPFNFEELIKHIKRCVWS
ncbi:MAG: response regulator [Candidatus Omnitrophota bacterium]|nr:response regulator [Candidatus Omnitrophota bacterium]MBU1929746.1 response regulator [Candidatus Omnitrophota bacterium]MBU2035144.1 response regulator [Candidatus Omnitrophota bacterium]MBU2258804.1 response regulator [Candidatus Omnitrophota bacterium]